MAMERVTRKLAAIFAADMVGYSRLMEKDEEGTIARQKAHRAELIDPKFAEHGGRIVKSTGDAVLVEFASAVDAVRCAAEIQRTIAEREADVPEDRRISYRVGINIGDIVIDGEDILGDGVNIAARLEAMAGPGGVCVSGTVHEHVAGKLDLDFDDMGDQRVKNIERPVRAYRVQLDGMDQGTGSAAASRTPSLELPDKPSIAVLPFDNMSGDPEQEYFADGITEDVITALSRLRWFFVIARNSTFAYKGKPTNVTQVARELGVRYVLEGSTRKSGNRVRVTCQLIDATDGHHGWSERYDREIAEIFELQDDITSNIVAATQTQLILSVGEHVSQRTLPDLGIWEALSRAKQLIYRLTRDDLATAKVWLKDAIAKAPANSDALGLLASCCYHEAVLGFAPSRSQATEEAEGLARRAIALDQDSEYSHWILGVILFDQGALDDAAAELRRALELNPNESLAYGVLGALQCYLGLPEEGIVNLERCVRANPWDPSIFFRFADLAHANFLLERYEKAVEWARKSLQRRPDWRFALLMLGTSLVQLARVDEAQSAVREYLRLSPSGSLSKLQRHLPHRRPGDRERLVNALRAAGLPE